MNTPSLFTPLETGQSGNKKSRSEIFNDYDGFVEKFKSKKTTDDCYTPPVVYETVKKWVNDNIQSLEGIEIVRPFYPGGDFEHYDYPENCIVIDNPPFSILARIRRFYHQRGIRYFLFAPSLTLANGANELECSYIVAEAKIIYENGAVVRTSFITNLDTKGIGIWVAGDLTEQIDNVQKQLSTSKSFPAFEYPVYVTSSALLGKIASSGMVLKFHKDSIFRISKLESQTTKNKAIFGGGWLLSEKAAEKKAAAEKAAKKKAAEKKAAEKEKIVWELSEREKDIIKNLK